jgi:hypothetical protein
MNRDFQQAALQNLAEVAAREQSRQRLGLRLSSAAFLRLPHKLLQFIGLVSVRLRGRESWRSPICNLQLTIIIFQLVNKKTGPEGPVDYPSSTVEGSHCTCNRKNLCGSDPIVKV